MAIKLTVEIPMFFAFFGFMLTDSVNTNIMIYRTCYVILGFDKHNCSLLGGVNNDPKLEALVQPKADVIIMVKSVVDSVSAAFLVVFVGAWSDRFGRKPVIVLNLIGYTVMMLVMVVFSAWENASPWLMMTCSIPVILTGGGASLLTVFLAYLTDVTSEQHRGLRMGIFDSFMAMAVLIGGSSSSYLFRATNYIVVYLVGAVSCFIALLYTIVRIPESLEVRESHQDRVIGFFEIQNASGIFKTALKSRPNYTRAIILLVVFALALYFVVIFGDGSVMFLFMREKFLWSLKQYTLYNSATNVMWITGGFTIVYLIHHKLKVKESYLIFSGFVSMMFGSLIVGLARVDWLIYVAALVRIPSSGLSPMTRSLISKLVSEDEVAKMFALVNITQSLLGVVSAPVYTMLYNATLKSDPGIFNFVTVGAHAVNTLCIIVVLILQKRTSQDNYSALQNENINEENQTNIHSILAASDGNVINS